MKLSLCFLSMLFAINLIAQKVVNKEIPSEGSIVLTDGISIPKIKPGYTLWLPNRAQVKGLIVFTHPRRDTTNTDFLIDYACSNGLAVLYTVTDNRLEFFFDQAKLQEVENYIHEVISNYKIPIDNMMYCGMSLEGTRALKLAIYGHSSKSKFQLKPKAIAICDSPLDMVRFHKESTRAKKLNFNPIAANEGKWVSAYLECNLGGSPSEALEAYIDYCPYTYIADGGPHLSALKDIHIRAYQEPDVNWWIETRRKDYYGMNAVDLAGLICELRILGSNKVELINTQDKGYRPDGSRHPHSWSIVNEKELVDWFMELEN